MPLGYRNNIVLFFIVSIGNKIMVDMIGKVNEKTTSLVELKYLGTRGI